MTIPMTYIINELFSFQMFEWNLNEQVIEDLFKSSHSNASISLNLTRTSRQNQQQKQKQLNLQMPDILQKFQEQISKYNNWMQQNTKAQKQSLMQIDSFIQKNWSLDFIKFNESQMSELEQRLQFYVKQNLMSNQQGNNCKNCSNYKHLARELNLELQNIIQYQSQCRKQIKQLSQKINIMQIETVKQSILSKTELNIVKEQKEQLQFQNKKCLQELQKLNVQVQKYNCEKTSYQFKNKTLENKLHSMEKSFKGLSAAKNSTSHSDIIRCPQSSMTNLNQFCCTMYPQDYVHMLQKLNGIFVQKHERQLNQFLKVIDPSQIQAQRQKYIKNSWKFKIHKCAKCLLSLFKRHKQLVFKQIIQEYSKMNSQKGKNIFVIDKDNQLLFDENQEKIKKYIMKIEGLSTQNINLSNQLKVIRQNLIKQKQVATTSERKYKQLQSQLSSLKTLLNGQQYNVNFLEKQLSQVQKTKRKSQQMQRQILNDLQTKIKKMQFLFKKQKCQRKKISLQFQNYKGSIRVYCKIKQKTMEQRSHKTFIQAYEDRIIVQNQKKSFKFDRVFSSKSSQSQLFYPIKCLIRSSMDNNNLTLLSCGQINSGKKQIMHGQSKNSQKSKNNCGIIFKTINEIFTLIQIQSQFINRRVRVQIVQLDSNGNIFDLLNPHSPINSCEKQNIKSLNRFSNKQIHDSEDFQNLYQKVTKKQTQQRKNSAFIISFQVSSIGQKKDQAQIKTKYNIVQLMPFSHNDSAQNQIYRRCLNNLSLTVNNISNYKKRIELKYDPLTHLLTQSLTPQSKIVVIVNVCQRQQKLKTIQLLKYGVGLKSLQKAELKRKQKTQQHYKN